MPWHLSLFFLFFFVSSCNSESTYFPHKQGLLWNYKIIFRSDYTGVEESKRLSVTNVSLFKDKKGIAYSKVFSNGNIVSFLKEKHNKSLLRTRAILKSTNGLDEPVKKILYPSTLFEKEKWKAISQLFITRGYQPPLRGFIPSAIFDINYSIKKRDFTFELQGRKFLNCIYIEGIGNSEFIADTRSGPIPIEIKTKEWLCPGVGLVKEERTESTNASAFGNMFYKAELIDFKD